MDFNNEGLDALYLTMKRRGGYENQPLVRRRLGCAVAVHQTDSSYQKSRLCALPNQGCLKIFKPLH